jgi:tetratricopeptide (TPR) repeat protein
VLALDRSLSAESADVANALNDLANAEADAGDLAAAERDYREALRVARAVGDAEGVATYTGNLVALALDGKDWPGAEALALEALALSEKVGLQELIAEDCRRLAQALVRQGKAGEALPHAQRAVEIYTRLGSPTLEEARAALRECES